jgi:phosphoribosylformimino-5-aminoimidazole carboxamide ribotide isomerase
MYILPAIDLRNGRCVRLRQGLPDQMTVYNDDPVAVARQWKAEGAEWLHVVDLDGAFEGRPKHRDVVARIVSEVGLPVEFGGGLRTDEDVRLMLDAGVARVVLGTRVCTQPAELDRLVAAFGARLAVGIDARDGWVQIRGWAEKTGLRAVELGARVAKAGVRTVIYTDTATDGMLAGPNLAAVGEMCAAAGCDVIASGGVSAAADVARLCGLERPNLVGAIVGKALYEGAARLPDLIRAGRGEPAPC